MPANLSPEYLKAEREYRSASTPEEKLDALRRMLSTIPKHKGTEKLQADIKRRIARAREEMARQAKRKGYSVRVEREGAGQIAVVGPPNSGKSSLVSALTGVELEVASYPFTTQRPLPAMMPFEDVQVQLVDLPPVSSVHVESWFPNLLRTADGALLVVDGSTADALEEIGDTLRLLEERKVRLVGHAVEEDPWASVVQKRTLLALSRWDLEGAASNLEVLQELYAERFPLLPVSARTLENVERLRTELFRLLGIVRVYSKRPQHEPDMDRPYVLPVGSTLLDFARVVHKDFARQLRFARIWGEGKFDGQRVQKDHVLDDHDVVELHA